MNLFKLSLRVGLVAALTVLVSVSANAGLRLSQYIVTTPSLTWTDITGSGTITSGKIPYYSGGVSTSMPFAFNYDNTSIASGSTVYINCAGLSFGYSSSPNYVQHGGLASATYQARLIPFGAYYMAIGSGRTGTMGVYTQITGSSPSRV